LLIIYKEDKIMAKEIHFSKHQQSKPSAVEVDNLLDKLSSINNIKEAVDNEFYNLWMSKALNVQQLEIFLANYFARTLRTVERVFDAMKALIKPELMLKNPSYRAAVFENLQNLSEEMGTHNPEKAHVVLLRDWINDLLKRTGSALYPVEDNYEKYLLNTTKAFSAVQKELYNDINPETVLAASYSQEVCAAKMLGNLKDGFLNNYGHLYKDLGELYQHSEYFAQHVFGVEEGHAEMAKSVIYNLCDSYAALERIEYSFNTFRDITISYWQGIANAIKAVS
jgi:hypothetical protein